MGETPTDCGMASFKEAVRATKDKKAAANPDSDYAKVRAIEYQAKAAFPDDRDMDQRFDLRNQLRAEAGLGPEKRKRGGFAGALDKGFLAPALAIGLGPLALGLAGGGAGAGAGAAGSTAAGGAGGLAPIAAAPAAGGVAGGAAGGIGAAASPWSLSGLASGAGNWLKDPKNLLKLGAGAYGISQQQKGAGQMNDALEADKARWAAGAPLHEQGRAGMLAPVPVDTSRLSQLSARGNPFSLPPVPAGGR